MCSAFSGQLLDGSLSPYPPSHAVGQYVPAAIHIFMAKVLSQLLYDMAVLLTGSANQPFGGKVSSENQWSSS